MTADEPSDEEGRGCAQALLVLILVGAAGRGLMWLWERVF